MLKNMITSIGIAILLCACGTPKPSLLKPHEEAVQDYGQYPENYENIVKEYFASTLFDPESAKYQSILHPVTGYTTTQPRKFGYIVLVRLNAKNRMGGFTGPQMYYVLIRDGKVLECQHKGE